MIRNKCITFSLPKKINKSDRQKHRITAGDIMAWLKVL
ncbi:alpha-ketoglutarate permease [Escherichia coli]|nr:alpha-ketoglutarate permease [Escherichia coli]EEZ0539715.1 alpha-ketoglutarate permease [Escherichia coli]EFO0960652.1 alpha-ketoglutarate permease [Escherichia coli]EFO1353371.1 alpha-ketoglutarate permease [Escherichia coli]OTD07397.1 alpha-ketoglutarate permease [Escherichia coli]